MSDSIVQRFAKRQSESSNTRTASVKLAQEGGDLSGLFEREPKKEPSGKPPMAPKEDKKPKKAPMMDKGPMSEPEGDMDDLGLDLEEKSECDEICAMIETAEFTPEDIDRCIQALEDKKNALSGDSIDTEMDRPEAEMKNDMKKGPDKGPMMDKGPEKKTPLIDKAAGSGCSTTSMY
jgi:hypothetical protein